MTRTQDVKHVLHIIMLVFSLFVLAAPIVDANMLENCSEKSIDTQDQEEDLDDKLEEKAKTTMFFDALLTFVCNTFSTLQPSYQCYLYSYKNNYSLYKPPISHA